MPKVEGELEPERALPEIVQTGEFRGVNASLSLDLDQVLRSKE
jgi:hypothetical protein